MIKILSIADWTYSWFCHGYCFSRSCSCIRWYKIQYLAKNLEKIVVSEGMYCFGVRLTRAIFVLSKNRLGVIAPLSLFRYHDFSLVKSRKTRYNPYKHVS